MTGRSFLFVHSPLVGPSSLRRLAGAASAAGHQVTLPDLTPMATAASPCDDYLARAVAATDRLTDSVTIVGHSGAGAFLPALAARADVDGVLVFVDAVIPPRSGAHVTPDHLKDLLDEQTGDDGLLRPWLAWWPPEVISGLLPDPDDRAALAADMPQLPRSFYDVEVGVSAGWSDQGCAYLRLSGGYDPELAEAVARQWPTASLDSAHLGVHTDADRVLSEIMGLTDQVR